MSRTGSLSLLQSVLGIGVVVRVCVLRKLNTCVYICWKLLSNLLRLEYILYIDLHVHLYLFSRVGFEHTCIDIARYGSYYV